MTQAFSIQYSNEENAFIVSGDMTLTTASSAIEASADIFDNNADLIIDLKQVSAADSAGLALLIEWMRRATARHKPITFRYLPEQMQAIAKASGLDEILPLEDNS